MVVDSGALCLKGWNYADSSERDQLLQAFEKSAFSLCFSDVTRGRVHLDACWVDPFTSTTRGLWQIGLIVSMLALAC